MNAVKLPEELKAILAGFMGMLITEGLKSLSQWFHVDLSGKAATVTAAICSALFFFADSLLANIPPQYEGVANGLLLLLVAILSAYGIHRQFVRFGGSVPQG